MGKWISTEMPFGTAGVISSVVFYQMFRETDILEVWTSQLIKGHSDTGQTKHAGAWTILWLILFTRSLLVT